MAFAFEELSITVKPYRVRTKHISLGNSYGVFERINTTFLEADSNSVNGQGRLRGNMIKKDSCTEPLQLTRASYWKDWVKIARIYIP